MGGCGWSRASPQLDDPLASAIRRGAYACGDTEERFPSPSPTTCGAFPSSLELARPARTQRLVGTTTSTHHRGWGSHFSRSTLTKEELIHGAGF